MKKLFFLFVILFLFAFIHADNGVKCNQIVSDLTCHVINNASDINLNDWNSKGITSYNIVYDVPSNLILKYLDPNAEHVKNPVKLVLSNIKVDMRYADKIDSNIVFLNTSKISNLYIDWANSGSLQIIPNDSVIDDLNISKGTEIKIFSNNVVNLNNIEMNDGVIKIESDPHVKSKLKLNNNTISLTDGFILTDYLELNRVRLELNNVFLKPRNNQIMDINCFGNNSIIIFKGLKSWQFPSDNYNYNLYSYGTKNFVINITNLNLSNLDLNFEFYPIQRGDANYFILISDTENKTSKFIANLIYSPLADAKQFYNLLKVSNSSNVSINGPDFNRIDLLPSNANMITVENSDKINISNFKYYIDDYVKKDIRNGNPISLIVNENEDIRLLYSVINNANVAIKLFGNINTSSRLINIYSNSFGYNNYILNKDLNVFTRFFNNLLIENENVTNQNQKLFLSLNSNKSNGISSDCDVNKINTLFGFKFPLESIPMYYFKEDNFIQTYYSPKCYGGNLYYEKQAALGCVTDCFIDSDNDSVFEKTYTIGIVSDFAPLIYVHEKETQNDSELQLNIVGLKTEYDSKEILDVNLQASFSITQDCTSKKIDIQKVNYLILDSSG